MEIKHSSEVARPVEAGKKPARWPWVIGGVGLAIVLVVGAVIGWMLWSGRGSGQIANTTDESQSQDSETAEGARDIARQPSASSLDALIFTQYEDPTSSSEIAEFTGPASIYRASSDDTGALDAERVAEYERIGSAGLLNMAVSPNAQFAAIVDPAPVEGGPGTAAIALLDIESEKIETLATLETSNVFGLTWSEDSSRFYVTANTLGEPSSTALAGLSKSELLMADVATGKIASFEREEADDNRFVIPLAVRDDTLFAMTETLGGPNAKLGTIELGDDGAADGSFTKLLDLEQFVGAQDIDVSADGSSVVYTHGFSEPPSGIVEGPWAIELLDVSSGELTQLRESASEEYNHPRFVGGDAIVYGAASGIWTYDLGTDDREQLFDEDLMSGLGVADVYPVSVRPDGDAIVILGGDNSENQLYVMPFGSASVDEDELGIIGEPPQSENSFFGWTQ